MFTDDTLRGQTILVTGGGSGLGFSMADRFAELGANVAICGRSEEKLTAASEKLRRHGTSVIAKSLDVRDYEGVGAFVSEIVKELGSLSGLVNNAAGNFLCPSEDLSPNGFKTVVDIVLSGTFNCTQQFGKYLIEQKKSGSVLNIVTTYTQTGSAFVLPSACAKAGVLALTTSLAYEWAPYNIRLNAIAPGPFPTPGAWSRLMPDPKFEERFKARHPMKRFGEAIELANLAVYLMSEDAQYINGSCVTIDGGLQLEAGQFNFAARMMPREQLKKMFAEMTGK